MNWKYALLHPKKTIKYANRLKEKIEKLDFSLYGERDWKIEKENDLIKAICPCMTEAIETADVKEKDQYHFRPEIFTSIKFICPRCNKAINIPKLRERNAKFLHEDELKESEVIRNLRE